VPPFVRHIFVCENQRPAGHPKGCCADKGSAQLRQALKAAIGEAGLSGLVRANSAGCLDACEYGASVVVYPEATWYGGVTVNDVPEIVQSHLKEGRPVERLRIHFAEGDSGEATVAMPSPVDKTR
jgi:(2Fe-2S) ferredoxin